MAYICLVIQYFWVALLVLPSLIENGTFDYVSPPSAQHAPVIEAPAIEPSPLVLLIISAVTVGLIMATVIAIIRTPKAVVHGGEKVMHRAAAAVVPTIIHHKKVPKKRRIELSQRVAFAFQIIALVIPLIASFFIPEVGGISKQIVLIVSALFALLSLVGFTLSRLAEPTKAISRTRSHVSRE